MPSLFLRWGPPLIGVAFAAGLQLSEAAQHVIGWVLIALALILSALYVFLERRYQRRKAEAQAKRRRRAEREADERRKERFSKYAYLMTEEQKAELLPKRKAHHLQGDDAASRSPRSSELREK